MQAAGALMEGSSLDSVLTPLDMSQQLICGIRNNVLNQVGEVSERQPSQ